MVSLPVRVELQVGRSDPTCSLTIPSISFLVRPVSGDFVILAKEADEPFALSIHAVAHYDTGDGSTLVLTRAVICDDYDDMLVKLDWLKTRYDIEDFRSAEAPEPHYILYRTIINLLDISDDVPIVLYDPDAVKMLAETCRTIWLANMFSKDDRLPLRSDVGSKITDTNGEIEAFHRLVFGYRKQHPSGVELRQIVKEWDAYVNRDGQYNWDVDEDLCQFVGKVIFDRLKCATPSFLKEAKIS